MLALAEEHGVVGRNVWPAVDWKKLLKNVIEIDASDDFHRVSETWVVVGMGMRILSL